MKTLVINNREGLVQGQMQPLGKDARGVPMLGPCVTLLPGLNLVDSTQLSELRKNPGFEAQFNTKIPPSPAPEQSPEKVGKPILEVMLGAPTKDGKRTPIEVEDKLPLAKLQEETIKTLVAETLAADVLRSWEKEEVRPSIAHIIREQLEKIGANPGSPASAGR
jgi:hypothetical protein